MKSSSWRKILLRLDCPSEYLNTVGIHITAINFLAQSLFAFRERIVDLPITGLFLMNRENGVIFHERHIAKWPADVYGEKPLCSVVNIMENGNLEATLSLEQSWRGGEFDDLSDTSQTIRVESEDFGAPNGELRIVVRKRWFHKPVINWFLVQGTSRPVILRPGFV